MGSKEIKNKAFLGACVWLLVMLCSCTFKSDKMVSEKTIDDRKVEYEKYLAETYPDKTFTVEVWQEYGKTTGAAGLPDYEGYLIRQVITDSDGNRFQIFTYPKGEHSDDYQDVLDGKKYYNEKGQQVFFNEDGTVQFVAD